MGKPRFDNVRDSERYRRFSANYEVGNPVIDDLVVNYCNICELMDTELDAIQHEGTMVDGLHGLVQNPRIGNLHKFMTQKNTALGMLKRAAETLPEEADALDEFMG